MAYWYSTSGDDDAVAVEAQQRLRPNRGRTIPYAALCTVVNGSLVIMGNCGRSVSVLSARWESLDLCGTVKDLAPSVDWQSRVSSRVLLQS